MTTHARRSSGETAEIESAPTHARRALEEAEVVRPVRTRPFALGMVALATALSAGFVLTSSAPVTVAVAQPAPVTAAYESTVDTLSRGTVDREAAIASAAETTAPAAATTTTPAPKTMYVTSVAYLRAQANTNAKVLATLAVGAQVTVTGDAADGWQRYQRLDRRLREVGPAVRHRQASGRPRTASTKAAAVGAYQPAPGRQSSGAGRARDPRPPGRLHHLPRHHAVRQGGQRDTEHAAGGAVDIMVSSNRGPVAAWLQAAMGPRHHEVIYQQKIWTTQRASEGWRAMSDSGSATPTTTTTSTSPW